ncbi:MAG TPA: hypothetical protein VGE52_22040, partial [Pirellulales bacterium]
EQSDRYVLVVGSDKVVSRRSVLPGRLQHGLRVILQGLNADEWVIVEGVQRARPGEVVVPHEVPMPEAAGSPTMGVGPLPAGSTGAPAPKLPGAENATPTAPAAAPAGNPAPAADTVPAAAPAPAASPMPPAAPTPSPTAPSGGSPAANPTN